MFFIKTPHTPISTLFPYTTLFRSLRLVDGEALHRVARRIAQEPQRILAAQVQVHHVVRLLSDTARDRKSTRLNSSHVAISYAVFRVKKKKNSVLAET